MSDTDDMRDSTDESGTPSSDGASAEEQTADDATDTIPGGNHYHGPAGTVIQIDGSFEGNITLL
ncbi:hypothetical protein [Actinomadura logoneensis]|uniref:hypothetical protein n=1 Tax=Actinomadura logoneensis TaxID=2293572 RepID=UPI0011C0CDE2|nr:hypothetical protein [Actinomadura logoneensis]